MYHWDFSILWSYRALLVAGLAYTLAFTALCIVCGMAIGIVAGIGRLAKSRVVSGAFRAYVELFRCTPILVQLVWFYYALPVLTGIQISAPVAAGLALSLYGGAFYAEIIRGGIIATARGQIEAARALGMRPHQVMRWIVLPPAVKRMVPPLMSQSIMQLKNTSLLSVLAVPDLLYQGQVIAHETYRPLELYTFIAVAYLVVLVPVTVWAKRREIGGAAFDG